MKSSINSVAGVATFSVAWRLGDAFYLVASTRHPFTFLGQGDYHVVVYSAGAQEAHLIQPFKRRSDFESTATKCQKVQVSSQYAIVGSTARLKCS